MKNKIRLTIVLICAGIALLLIPIMCLHNKKENESFSKKSENIFYAKKSQEDEFYLGEQQEYYDIWEEEHVLEIGFGYNENATQDDIDHIGKLIHLKRLKISIDDEINLSPLGNLVELESLDINIQYGCSADLSFVVNMSQLQRLHMTVGGNVDLSPLGNLNDLRKLSIDTWGDELDLSFLRKPNQLEEVIIDKGTIEDLSLFQNMPNLQRLDVSYIDDCDLNYLADLNNLETLAIIGENIRNPEGLSNLSHLKSVSLYDNSLDARCGDTEREPLDLRAFANLNELEWLDLAYIYIEDISPLSSLYNLRQIGLIGTDVGDILPLTSLEKLDELYLFGNKSKQVKEQAEKFFNEIEYMIVTEEIPNGL